MFGSTELIVILAVVVILFGARSIARVARSLGQARREFQQGLKDGQAGEGDAGEGGGAERRPPEAGPG